VTRLETLTDQPPQILQANQGHLWSTEYFLVGQRVSVYHNLNAIPARILKREERETRSKGHNQQDQLQSLALDPSGEEASSLAQTTQKTDLTLRNKL
jgi:hypothetical protein